MLPRADILVLRMLADNNERVVHFSRTSGNLAEELGLGGYVVTQGHSRRVMPDSVISTANIVRVPGEGYVDVAVSLALWNEFKAPASLIRKGDWVDGPSKGIPGLVVTTGIATAEALMQAGRQADAERIIATTREVAVAMRFDDLVRSLAPQLPTPPPTNDAPAKTPVPVRP